MRWKAWGLLGVQLALVVCVISLPRGDAWVLSTAAARGAKIVSWAGLVIVAAALLNLGGSASPLPVPAAGGTLRTGGLFRFVRHPIYGGISAWAIASAVASGSVAVAVCGVALVAWLSMKARWEEQRLAERYPGYAEYAARTPLFIPSWRVR